MAATKPAPDVKLSEAEAQKKREELILFCSTCFASTDNASWNGEVTDFMCGNCGAGGPNLKIPRWAVKSIREQASWVGKRFYANEEDIETYEEVRALRAMVKEFPGRSVRRGEDGMFWWVTQDKGGGTSTSVMIEKSEAKTANGALAKARLQLPYVSEKQLRAKKKEKPR